MRRALLFFAAVLMVSAPVSAGQEIRWVSFVRGDTDTFTGSLEVVRTDGQGRRTLLEDGVRGVDLGPDGTVFAIREEDEGDDTLPPSTLLRIPAEGGQAAPVFGQGRGTAALAVAASPDGDVAVLRLVPRSTDPPPHLAPAIPTLRDTDLPILAPPDEPPDTGSVVADAAEDFYELLFTNDPQSELSHAEQVNVFVRATTGEDDEGFEDAQPVEVRGRNGRFSCGASTCFLTWRENRTHYTVGEFGDQDAAAAFAGSLRPIEELAGFLWRDEQGYPLPELVIRRDDGERVRLESVEDFCECAFIPTDWSPDRERLLVITAAEGYTTLQEYATDGTGRPETLTESSVFEGGQIVDAGYGPQGVLIVLAGEGGPPGRLRSLDGRRIVKGKVRAFDVSGMTLAYVTGGGDVRVRDLTSGQEQTLAEGALDVSIGPDAVPVPQAPVAREQGGPPVVLAVLVGLAGASLLLGGILYAVSRAKR
ncbi:MAG TPA: hypothetical protein VGB28_08405 [Actinomycetota bacterium]